MGWGGVGIAEAVGRAAPVLGVEICQGSAHQALPTRPPSTRLCPPGGVLLPIGSKAPELEEVLY